MPARLLLQFLVSNCLWGLILELVAASHQTGGVEDKQQT